MIIIEMLFCKKKKVVICLFNMLGLNFMSYCNSKCVFF